MPALTLTNLTDRIRNLIDDEDAVLISATEIIQMINHSGRQWLALAAQHQPTLFRRTQAHTPAGAGAGYNIDDTADDYWQVSAVGYYDNDLVLHPVRKVSSYKEVTEIGFETNKTGVPEWYYQQDDNTIIFYPYPTAADVSSLVIHYTKRWAELSAGGDYFMGPGIGPSENVEVWADWVIYDVCMKARIKERDDWQTFKALRDDTEDRMLYSTFNAVNEQDRVRHNPLTGRRALKNTTDPDFWRNR